jgi:hypothetical protein
VTDADNRKVLECDGAAGAIRRWYAFGLGPAAVLNQMNVPGTGTRATLIPDIQGSIVGTLDSGTGALTKIGYLPFGENPSLSSGTYRYTGRRLDPETAGSTAEPSGLYYYRARYSRLSPVLSGLCRKCRIAPAAVAVWFTHVRTGQTRNRCVGAQDPVPDTARVSDAELRPELECRSDRQPADRPI